jgi:hypothetical protein
MYLLLAEAGADKEAARLQGLLIAASKCHLDLMRFLVTDAKADIAAVDSTVRHHFTKGDVTESTKFVYTAHSSVHTSLCHPAVSLWFEAHS